MPFKTPEKKKKKSGMRKYMYLMPLVAAGGLLLADSMSAPQAEVFAEAAPNPIPTPSRTPYAVPKGVKFAGGLALGTGLIGYASGSRMTKVLRKEIEKLKAGTNQKNQEIAGLHSLIVELKRALQFMPPH
jgi:hypothetical protein